MSLKEEYRQYAEGKTKTYEVSSFGNVRSFNKNTGEYRFVEPRQTFEGELIIHVPKKNGKKGWDTKYLKQLVAEIFLPPEFQKKEGDYSRVWSFKDDNKKNCRADNIELLTVDAWYTKYEGTFGGFSDLINDRNKTAVIKYVPTMLGLLEKGVQISDIANIFHRHPDTIQRAIDKYKKKHNKKALQ